MQNILKIRITKTVLSLIYLKMSTIDMVEQVIGCIVTTVVDVVLGIHCPTGATIVVSGLNSKEMA